MNNPCKPVPWYLKAFVNCFGQSSFNMPMVKRGQSSIEKRIERLYNTFFDALAINKTDGTFKGSPFWASLRLPPLAVTPFLLICAEP
jgi:hypothetical protein